MRPEIEPRVHALVQRVDSLSQWERAELGRSLRRAGWTYSEIAEVIPAAKSTIAGWCRTILLQPEQVAAIRTRTGSQEGIPRDTQRKRRRERQAIIETGTLEAAIRSEDPVWCAGLMLYWGEGFKTENCLGLANSDVDLLRFFMEWARVYHAPRIEFRAKLNLHADNDEEAAVAHWAAALEIPVSSFNKTFIKPGGTGHRRNHLPHGVLQVRARRSTDYFLKTMGWIEGMRRVWSSDLGSD